MATRVVSRVRQAFNIELPIPTIFKEPKVVDLAGTIDEALKKSGAPDDSEMIQVLGELEDLSEEEAQRLLDKELGTQKNS